jgi:enamine deaminase RidA (YjgF/YER057c/UK114 family)
MTIEPLDPPGWTQGRGYAHGMSATGRLVVTAGQIGWDPVSCEVVSEDFAAQAAQALRNIVAVLRAGRAGPEHLVRLTWYVTSREEYVAAGKAVGAAYREIIGKHYPAMAVVIVHALLDKGAKVEIEATAVVPA